MQIGKVYISKIYPLWEHFVLGIGFETSIHVHKKNEGEYQDIIKWELDEVETNELVVTLEFLFWGIDFQINRN
jgi:hypothetical protein